jgi:hypothetical protein
VAQFLWIKLRAVKACDKLTQAKPFSTKALALVHEICPKLPQGLLRPERNAHSQPGRIITTI